MSLFQTVRCEWDFSRQSLTHFSLRDVAHAEFVSVLICSLSDAEFKICVADYARRKRV